jgi:hypothetical protein
MLIQLRRSAAAIPFEHTPQLQASLRQQRRRTRT